MSTVNHATIALITCFLATATPIFFGKLRVAPTWLGLQALALGWLALNRADSNLHALMAGLEILLLRGWLVPWGLRRALAQQPTVQHVDVMPSNLFTWGIAITLIIVAFQFGNGARADLRALTLGVIAAMLTMSFLVLATNREPLAQLVALLFMENAVLLFETQQPHPWPAPVHVVLGIVYLGTAALGLWLASSAHASTPAARPGEDQQ